MQDRKRLEEQIAQDVKISGLTSDLDTMLSSDAKARTSLRISSGT